MEFRRVLFRSGRDRCRPSERHVHERVEGLDLRVAHGDRELGGEGGLSGGDGVVVDVGQRAGGGLRGEDVDVVVRGRQVVEGADDGVAEPVCTASTRGAGGGAGGGGVGKGRHGGEPAGGGGGDRLDGHLGHFPIWRAAR